MAVTYAEFFDQVSFGVEKKEGHKLQMLSPDVVGESLELRRFGPRARPPLQEPTLERKAATNSIHASCPAKNHVLRVAGFVCD